MELPRLQHTNRISDLLTELGAKLKARSRAGRTDANHIIERCLVPFFNVLFDWKLEWLEPQAANYPAVDLADFGRRLAIQVTNQDDGKKISHTAAKAREHALSGDVDRIIIFFLLPEAPTVPKKFQPAPKDPQFEIWDIPRVVNLITDLEGIDLLKQAADVLQKEMGQRLLDQRLLHQLPPIPDSFTGREEDLETLNDADPASGTVLTGLRGMGGIGKTALATVLAHQWMPRFLDAQIVLTGQGTQPVPPTAEDLLARVINTFYPESKLPEDLDTLQKIYREVLHGKQVLILLDNAADAKQCAPLIPPSGSALIVTTRGNFMLGGKAAFSVGKLRPEQATALLRKLYPALTDADAAELVTLCAGLPLALRLAGSHLALDAGERGGTANVAAYLKDLRSGRLATLDADADDAGEITISETLRLSEDQLSAADRQAWRNLAVFSASFEATAAAAIAGAGEKLLATFVRRSLLERDGPDRYALHDLAADYARAQHPAEALILLHLIHAVHFIQVGEETHNLYVAGDQVGGLALFDRERLQIEAAFAYLQAGVGTLLSRPNDAPPAECGQECPHSTLLIALVDAIVYTGQSLRFHPRQLITWLEAQRTAAHLTGDRAAEGRALGSLGLAHADLGDTLQAISFYEQELVIARGMGDRQGEGRALGNLGIAHADLGDARQAISFYEQQLVIAREIGDRRGEGNALGNLGNAHAALGGTRQAISFHEQALVISREIGDRRGEGQDLGNLGNAHAALGDARQAISFYEQALVIAREIGDRRGEGHVCWNSAVQFWKLGERAESIRRAEAALQIYEAIEAPNAAMVRAALAEWREA